MCVKGVTVYFSDWFKCCILLLSPAAGLVRRSVNAEM
jgi:hypothetical protein